VRYDGDYDLIATITSQPGPLVNGRGRRADGVA